MYEESLGFKEVRVQKIASELAKVSAHDLTPRQVSQLLESLGIRAPDFRDASSPLTNFYTTFRVERKISRAQLAALCVLLAAGDIETKCAVLEQFYAGEDSNIEAVDLLRDLCEIALVRLPMYTYLELQLARDKPSIAKLTKYTDKLRRAKIAMLRYLKRHLLVALSEPSIEPGTLLAQSGTAPISSLFASHSLRISAVSVPADDQRPAVISILKTPSTSPLPSPTMKRSVRFVPQSAV